MTERRCLTPDEYATERRVSLKTVYRMLKAGKIPTAVRVGSQWRIWLGQRTTTDSNPQTRTPA